VQRGDIESPDPIVAPAASRDERRRGCSQAPPRFDAAAPSFDRYRALPTEAAQAIRRAVLAAARNQRARILDLGAGSGRIGWPFVAAGDDYIAADLAFGMLRAFAARDDLGGQGAPRLVQAAGDQLPFPDAIFDIVMLMQVFGGQRAWRQLLAEARRVLRRTGVLVLGRTIMPDAGVDARMKHRLDEVLADLGALQEAKNLRRNAESLLVGTASHVSEHIAAQWQAVRSPRAFVERHRTGARFSRLPEDVKDEALHRLAAWAEKHFGSLDASSTEQHCFELKIFTFQPAAGH
jgi:ubiquinone/menaquinone biosynthesis C-methylase UbiE